MSYSGQVIDVTKIMESNVALARRISEYVDKNMDRYDVSIPSITVTHKAVLCDSCFGTVAPGEAHLIIAHPNNSIELFCLRCASSQLDLIEGVRKTKSNADKWFNNGRAL